MSDEQILEHFKESFSPKIEFHLLEIDHVDVVIVNAQFLELLFDFRFLELLFDSDLLQVASLAQLADLVNSSDSTLCKMTLTNDGSQAYFMKPFVQTGIDVDVFMRIAQKQITR